jgi:SAM-dependent methyltransferase
MTGPARADRLAFGVEPSDRRFRLRLARYPALADTLAAFLREAPARVRLLDAGVGRGRSRRYLAPDIAERATFVGVDLHPQLTLRCHESSAWRLTRADVARPLPFRDGAFDAIVCEQVLEHVAEPSGPLHEFARCLRAGGLLVVGVPTFPPGVAGLRRRFAPQDEAESSHGHVQTFTKGSLLSLLRATGAFEVRSVRGFRSFSGGPLAPLEDFRWWWRLNDAFGRAFPSFCAEVQVTAVRNGSRVTAASPPRSIEVAAAHAEGGRRGVDRP